MKERRSVDHTGFFETITRPTPKLEKALAMAKLAEELIGKPMGKFGTKEWNALKILMGSARVAESGEEINQVSIAKETGFSRQTVGRAMQAIKKK